jgi:hypothetical protein
MLITVCRSEKEEFAPVMHVRKLAKELCAYGKLEFLLCLMVRFRRKEVVVRLFSGARFDHWHTLLEEA